jgi:hypothetical protein
MTTEPPTELPTGELRNAAILDSVGLRYHATRTRSTGDSWARSWQAPWEESHVYGEGENDKISKMRGKKRKCRPLRDRQHTGIHCDRRRTSRCIQCVMRCSWWRMCWWNFLTK